jgi:hypothetical protein
MKTILLDGGKKSKWTGHLVKQHITRRQFPGASCIGGASLILPPTRVSGVSEDIRMRAIGAGLFEHIFTDYRSPIITPEDA